MDTWMGHMWVLFIIYKSYYFKCIDRTVWFIHLGYYVRYYKMAESNSFLATAYHATVEGGHFTTTGDNGYARAMEIMNSKCINDFRWSVVLRTDEPIWIGIASKLQRTDDNIKSYDKTAILCFPTGGSFFHGEISEGSKSLVAQFGDEIHFIFQSKLKKFSIILVR